MRDMFADSRNVNKTSTVVFKSAACTTSASIELFAVANSCTCCYDAAKVQHLNRKLYASLHLRSRTHTFTRQVYNQLVTDCTRRLRPTCTAFQNEQRNTQFRTRTMLKIYNAPSPLRQHCIINLLVGRYFTIESNVN